MKTLDRYIVRNFVGSAILWFVVLMALRIVTDLFVNIDEFAELKEPFGDTLGHIGTFYGYQSLLYFIELGGVIIVAAATFSLARMNRTNELTAILASGVSLHRVVWPVVLCAMLMGGAIIADQEFVIPRVASKLVRSRDDVPGTEEFRVQMTTDGRNTVWYSPKFRLAGGVMERPVLFVRDQDFHVLLSISGRRARPKVLDDCAGWLITEAQLSPEGDDRNPWYQSPNCRKVWTRIGPDGLLEKAILDARQAGQDIPEDRKRIAHAGPVSDRDDAYGLEITAERLYPARVSGGRVRPAWLQQPRFIFTGRAGQPLGTIYAESARWKQGQGDDAGWELTGGALFYPSDLTAEDLVLRQSSRWLQYMSFGELTRLIRLKRVPDRQAAELTKHVRIADPVNNLVMLLLGLPFILSRERNIKASATLCLLMVGTFYAFIFVCRYIDLSPTWAAWLPVLLFGPVAVVMLDAVKT